MRAVRSTLLREEILSIVQDPDAFPMIGEVWARVGAIQNAIIDVDGELPKFARIFQQLGDLGCDFVQIRCYSTFITPGVMDSIANEARDKGLRGIQVLIRFDKSVSETLWTQILEEQRIINGLLLHSTDPETMRSLAISRPERGSEERRSPEYSGKIIRSSACCANINRSRFLRRKQTFMRRQNRSMVV